MKTGGTFNLWAFGDAHVGTDEPQTLLEAVSRLLEEQ